MRKWIAVVLAAVVVSGACTGDDDEGGSTPNVPSPPQRGGVLRVGVAPLGSLDPAQARSVDQLLVADQLFDSLTVFDPATSEVAPALAARWEASADLRQWDFVLRPGVTFANGRPLTPADVKYTLERIAKPGSGSLGSELLTSVTGYSAFAVQASAPDLAGVTTPAADVVRITLDQPWAVLPVVLTNPVFGVVPKEAVEAPSPAFAEAPVGSGPFAMKGREGDVISLAAVAGGRALVDGIDLVQVPDVAAGYSAFADGRLDVASVPPEQVDTAARRYGRDAYRPYLAEVFYAFNLKSPKLADPRFREAIVRGIDRRSIVRAVYGSTVTPADGVLVAGLAGSQEDACGERCKYDPTRARALVAEVFAGAPPPEVQLAYDEDEAQTAMAKAMQAGLAEIGITLVLAPKSLKDYTDYALSGQQELFRFGWIARYPSADDFLPPLFLTGSSNNLTGFSVPAVDEQLRAARAEPDAARRAELFRAAERAVMEFVPIIPVAQFHLHTVVGSRVRALTLTSFGTFDGAAVWLARPE